MERLFASRERRDNEGHLPDVRVLTDRDGPEWRARSGRLIKNTTNASDYSGYFRGIFRNESSESPQSNGYYVFDLQFNKTSWAAANNCGYDGGSPQSAPCQGLPALHDEFAAKK